MTFMVEADVAPRAYRLVGELDLATAERLTQELSPVLQTDGDVHLDVGDLEFMDSSGLRALIEISRSLSGRGHVFLNSPMGEVAKLLELIRAEKLPNLVIQPNGSAP